MVRRPVGPRGAHSPAESLCVVPTVVQFELFKWVCREGDEPLALEVAARMAQGLVRAFDLRVALLAAELSLAHRLAMADAFISGSPATFDAERLAIA